MLKILAIFFLFFSSVFSSFASDDIKIIKRSERWAQEDYRYLDSSYRQDIIKKEEINSKNRLEKLESMTKEERDKVEKKQIEEQTRKKVINYYLSTNYEDDNKIVETIKEENWHKLAWPITKTDNVKWIIIHHTWSDYKSSLDWINQIYKYHSINRWWWDIGYNYLIWYDWEIYEWRAWWDYVVWAQALWNNRSTVWIAVIWDYENKDLNQKQKDSLEKLVSYLINKYWIDLNEKFTYHKECLNLECDFPLITQKISPLIWHRDAGHTTCPWEYLYIFLDEIREKYLSDSKWLTFVSYSKQKEQKSTSSEILVSGKDDSSSNIKDNISVKKQTTLNQKLKTIDYYSLLDLLVVIDSKLKDNYSKDLSSLQDAIHSELKIRWDIETTKNNIDYTKKIKVKISYDKNDFISIKKWDKTYEIERRWDMLYLDWKEEKAMIIKSNKDSYLEISSFDRKPTWDKSWVYNDNKFKWDLIVYVKNYKLYVVNYLYLWDYLKWLWEISDSENVEKAKAIIIAARTYALWYIDEDRKFDWEFFDASDDPDVFQKYLWYSFEQRSPNLSKIVDETSGLIIKYNENIIKPWYFSSSDWNTLSFLDYCNKNIENLKKDNPSFNCELESKKYPYLSWVKDPGSIGKSRLWHWVWISWNWSYYFASRWWSYDMIIKYFLRWVQIDYYSNT